MPDPVQIFNTLTRETEPLRPLEPGRIRLYTCGPTVYQYAHIGNLRTYISEDFIKRALSVAGYEVRHVMNVTDVGHLQHDDIEAGEDKMSLAAQREKKDPWQIARFYEQAFLEDIEQLNIVHPDVLARATEHVPQMIEFIQALEERGFTYQVDGNVYFAVDRFEQYDLLRRGREAEAGEDVARVEPDPRKRDPRDFVLWFSQSKFPNQVMKWPSPWGEGFPGWHIECSTIGACHLGDRIDLHMGGIDHIPVHHTNEIAQSDCRFGHRWVTTWAHCNFLVIEEAKMAKSEGNFLRLATLTERGFDPMHFRYFAAQAHYRSQQKFNWDSLRGARDAYEGLKNLIVTWRLTADGQAHPERGTHHRDAFWEAAWDDFNLPRALAALWTMARDPELAPADKLALIRDFDRLLGFDVDRMRRPQLPKDLATLVARREEARAQRNWTQADQLREQLREHGIQLKDLPEGTDWYRLPREDVAGT